MKYLMNSWVFLVMNDKYSKYETLVRAFHSDIYRYAVWLIKDATIAEDVVKETFMRAWKSLDSLQDEKAAKAWLITILRRENARRFERKQFDYVDDIEDIPLVDDTAINDGERPSNKPYITPFNPFLMNIESHLFYRRCLVTLVKKLPICSS